MTGERSYLEKLLKGLENVMDDFSFRKRSLVKEVKRTKKPSQSSQKGISPKTKQKKEIPMSDTNVENHDDSTDSGLSPEACTEIWSAVETKWKEDFLKGLQRMDDGLDDVQDEDYAPYEVEIPLELKTHRGALNITAVVGDGQVREWIEDLEKQGCVTIDGIHVRGVGPYAKVPLTETERLVWLAINDSRGWTATLKGIKRKIKNKKLSADQIEEILEDLVKRGWIDRADYLGQPGYYRLLF